MPVDVASAPRDDSAIVPELPLQVNKTSMYVDGFNLYHAIAETGRSSLKWLDLRKLGESLLKPDEPLTDVFYFTAEMTWEAQKLARHRIYMAALKTAGVTTVVSKFLRTKKYCHAFDRQCVLREEKQTDVALSVRLMTDCLTNGVTRALVLTADSDQIPTIAALRGLRPDDLEVVVVVPPGRFEISRELRGVAHRFIELTPGKLERALLDRNVYNERGGLVASCPALYNHPDA